MEAVEVLLPGYFYGGVYERISTASYVSNNWKKIFRLRVYSTYGDKGFYFAVLVLRGFGEACERVPVLGRDGDCVVGSADIGIGTKKMGEIEGSVASRDTLISGLLAVPESGFHGGISRSH